MHHVCGTGGAAGSPRPVQDRWNATSRSPGALFYWVRGEVMPFQSNVRVR